LIRILQWIVHAYEQGTALSSAYSAIKYKKNKNQTVKMGLKIIWKKEKFGTRP